MTDVKETAGETAKSKEELIKERQTMIYAYGELSLQIEGLQSQGRVIADKMVEIKGLLIDNTKLINDIIKEEEKLKSDTE